jgi:hypothetical protein
VSQKYDAKERKQLFDEAGVQEVDSWSNELCDLGEYIQPFMLATGSNWIFQYIGFYLLKLLPN